MSRAELFTKENVIMGGLISVMAWGAISIMGMQTQNAVDKEINSLVRDTLPKINDNLTEIKIDLAVVKADMHNIKEGQATLKRDLDEIEDSQL